MTRFQETGLQGAADIVLAYASAAMLLGKADATDYESLILLKDHFASLKKTDDDCRAIFGEGR